MFDLIFSNYKPTVSKSTQGKVFKTHFKRTF